MPLWQALLWVSQTLTFLKAISTLQAPLDSNRKRGSARNPGVPSVGLSALVCECMQSSAMGHFDVNYHNGKEIK
jgi:hypothetical protein